MAHSKGVVDLWINMQSDMEYEKSEKQEDYHMKNHQKEWAYLLHT